jgi:hypothetical protein
MDESIDELWLWAFRSPWPDGEVSLLYLIKWTDMGSYVCPESSRRSSLCSRASSDSPDTSRTVRSARQRPRNGRRKQKWLSGYYQCLARS